MTALSASTGDRLPAWSLFGGVLSAAGLPIYIYAPKYYADTFGVSLAALGALLFALRLFDVVQDPVLGWIVERLGRVRGLAVMAGSGLLAVSMLGLFAVDPPLAPLIWFGVTITGLFTSFSFLTINFYAQGISKAGPARRACPAGRVARKRRPARGMHRRGGADAADRCRPGAVLGLRGRFCPRDAHRRHRDGAGMAGRGQVAEPMPVREIFDDPLARRLLVLALINATPLAVSSTLFLFFVESRLAAPGFEGPLLVLFFLAAAVSAPAWSWLASRYGAKPVLLSAMILAVASFGYTAFLGAGDWGRLP